MRKILHVLHMMLNKYCEHVVSIGCLRMNYSYTLYRREYMVWLHECQQNVVLGTNFCLFSSAHAR